MAKNIVSLSTKEDLKIFMSPQRQQILRTMGIHGDPVTAKALADMLGISASAITHHLRLLERLGVVALHHTQRINGITARYYALCDVTVNIGQQVQDDLANERNIIIQNILLNTLKGFNQRAEWAVQNGIPRESLADYGDFLSGVMHLTQQDAVNLVRLIRDYLEAHSTKQTGTQPWEYALILYQAGEMK